MRWSIWLFLLNPLAGIPITVELDLVGGEPGFNELEIQIDPGFNLADTDQATVSGRMIADLEVDPLTNEVSQMTLRTGSGPGDGIQFSDVSFQRSNFFLSYSLAGTQLGGSVVTPAPPGVVTPASGEFDASQYTFRLERGSLAGQATALGSRTELNQVISPADPVTGAGSGFGTIQVSTTSSSGPEPTYEAELRLPVDISREDEQNGLTIAISATGTILARGHFQITASSYVGWTIVEGIIGADPLADINGDGIANAFSWALGLDKNSSARAWLPTASPSGQGFELELPAGGTRAPLRLQVSSDLVEWSELPAQRVSLGENPLPAGTSGSVTIGGPGSTREFLRLQVDP